VNLVSGLSVFIITRNEEQDIAGCLESVKGLAAEIVVVDSGSTDRTMDICRTYGAKVFQQEWRGYGPQKQVALDHCAGPWALNIDADERVTLELAQEIRATLEAGGDLPNGYEIPFRHYFLGKRLRFGGVAGETHLRLFRKSEASYGGKQIHEGIRVAPPVGRMSNRVDHISYRDLTEYLDKCNLYTGLIAAEKRAKGESFSFLQHLRLPYEFFVRYVLKLGFLDGGAGFTYAMLSSFYVWMKYLKLQDIEGH
jgi:glycosyltransferase involved in cell wall biosynthesis